LKVRRHNNSKYERLHQHLVNTLNTQEFSILVILRQLRILNLFQKITTALLPRMKESKYNFTEMISEYLLFQQLHSETRLPVSVSEPIELIIMNTF